MDFPSDRLGLVHRVIGEVEPLGQIFDETMHGLMPWMHIDQGWMEQSLALSALEVIKPLVIANLDNMKGRARSHAATAES